MRSIFSPLKGLNAAQSLISRRHRGELAWMNGELQAEMDACRTVNDELTARAQQLERDLETTTRMYEAEVRARRTEAATVHSRPTSATDSAPVAAPASLHSPSVAVFTARRHASAVFAVVMCLSVCLSQVGVLLQRLRLPYNAFDK